MTVTELTLELTSSGLSVPGGNKVAKVAAVERSRSDLAGALQADALQISWHVIDQQQLPQQVGGSADTPIVQPLHGLPGPYELPLSQRQKRTAAPKGQQKWTAKRVGEALHNIAAGKVVQPLKKKRSLAEVRGEQQAAELASLEEEMAAEDAREVADGPQFGDDSESDAEDIFADAEEMAE